MSLNVGSLFATLDLDRRPFERGFAAWRTQTKAGARAATQDLERETGRQRDALGRFVKQSGDEGERSGRSWGKGFLKGLGSGDSNAAGGIAARILKSFTSVFEISAKSAATAFSAQFVGSVVAGLASGAAKIAHGAGALAALLPAAVLTGVTALQTMKLAVVGVGDAMSAAVTGDAKEFEEAIKGLSPAARGFAREIRGLRGDLKGLQQSVQDRFFAQWESQTTRLAKTWLPILRRELGALAEGFGDTVNSFATWARQPAVVLTLTMALRNARGAVSNLLAGATNLAQAFLPLIAVGSTFLPRLTRGFGDATGKLALFMQQAADTGRLAGWIQGGLDKLHSLGDTFGQLWRIGGNVVAVFREFGSMDSIFSALGIQTGGLLDQLETLTDKAKTFFQSAAGGQAITEIFSIVKSLLNATMGTLAHLAVILGRTFGPILPQISKFAEAIANLQLALADALAPALGAVADIIGVVLPPITDVMNIIADSGPAAAALAGELLGLYAAWKLMGAASKLSELNLSGAQLGMGGAAAAAAGLSMALIAIDAQRHAAEIDAMVEAFGALDGAVTSQSRGWLYLNQLMGTQDEFVSALIDSNPRLAQSLIDNAEAYGITAEDAARYQDELDTTTAAVDNQTDALTRQKNALRAMTDPVFAAMDAQQRLADAQQHLIDVEKDQNSTAADVQQAHQDVAQASIDLEAAQYDLGAAVESGGTSLEGYLAQLKRQVKAHGIAREDYNALALTAVATFGRTKRAVESVPTSRTVHFRAVDGASSAADKVAAKLRWLNGQSATVSITANYGAAVAQALGLFPKHHQGRIGGDEYVALLQRGESVLARNDPLNKALVGAGGDTSKLMAQGVGGATHIDVTIHGTGLLEGLRKTVRVEGGGSVQVALGS